MIPIASLSYSTFEVFKIKGQMSSARYNDEMSVQMLDKTYSCVFHLEGNKNSIVLFTSFVLNSNLGLWTFLLLFSDGLNHLVLDRGQ